MKSDVISVSGGGSGMEAALEQVEKISEYKELSRKGSLHLRLLAEEMMGLMRSVTGARTGLFWIEDQDGEYQLHLQVRTSLSGEEREQLLSVSSTGKNESARGLMGHLRDFFDWDSDDDISAFSGPLIMPDVFEQTTSPTLNWEWSMTRYTNVLSDRMKKNDPEAGEAWDELEKSVVRHVADDVKVFIRSGVVELVILKKTA